MKNAKKDEKIEDLLTLYKNSFFIFVEIPFKKIDKKIVATNSKEIVATISLS